ncbi:MAG: tRNA (N6-isopentenyl adenosine(37)-C2)-methylthiotransferase MiaB [Clostridia bacterium]|nr:tRNA (N6-isopentenyl adenosine(37)-C2)-methylthiotransferase MiaB [Clostridia bacterium]
MKKKYFITTYGCQLNVHESEKLAGILQNMGYTEANNIKTADVIIFNTCAIRGGAENRAMGNIGALKKYKLENKNKIIAVCGCMTQQKENADFIFKTFPFVDIIFGTTNIHLFQKFLEDREKTQKRQYDYSEDFNLKSENCPKYRTSGENAWVNIMQGCNNFCTYCIVPYVRGRERSKPQQDIITEIKELIKQKKYKKITLLGQNVNSYGNDTNQINFANLLKEICSLEGDFKLTFMTSHPKDLTSEVIDIIAQNDKMLKEIHLPIQSGSNKILKAMNRKYTVEKYLSIVEEIKSKIPNVRLTTDIIVGFPGETEQDFQNTCDLIKKVQYNGVFAFMYSKRKGTPAENMPNQVDEETKNQRVNEILKLTKENKKEN